MIETTDICGMDELNNFLPCLSGTVFFMQS